MIIMDEYFSKFLILSKTHLHRFLLLHLRLLALEEISPHRGKEGVASGQSPGAAHCGVHFGLYLFWSLGVTSKFSYKTTPY